MPSSVQPAGVCPKCGADSVACRYNFFDRGDLQVHAWEHKCTSCGWRQTQAYRSDAPAGSADTDPAVCPWCSRRGADGS
jgi:uncharacterized protein CbrC (UPF0167 family)